MKKALRIDELFAYLAVDEADGTEGIVAVGGISGVPNHPLVGADRDRMESYRSLVTQLCRTKRITLVRFSNRETLETFGPEGTVH